MGSTAEQWTLEFLLDQDGLSEGAVRELYEHLSGGGEPLSKTIQARLLLRVLREHAANISEATLNALNCLAATSSDIKSHYSPHANLQNLLPSLDLYLLVRVHCRQSKNVPSGCPQCKCMRIQSFLTAHPCLPAGKNRARTANASGRVGA